MTEEKIIEIMRKQQTSGSWGLIGVDSRQYKTVASEIMAEIKKEK